MTRSQNLRVWQREAFDLYQRAQPRDFLTVATPGAGKTTFALTIAADLISRGIVERIVIVTPTDHLKTQWALAAAGIGPEVVALHLHDTRGTALAGVMAALDAGVTAFDAAAGGTGGSPYAPGAAGNLATEDLVYLLDREGLRHGVDLDAVLAAARFIAERLGKPEVGSKLGRAGGWPR